MKRLKITRGGQVSVPAEVRHRWGTSVVTAEDRGDELVLRPASEDPIAAARGALRGAGNRMTTDELRERAREDELDSAKRRER